MDRAFKTVDDQAALDVTARLGACLPPDHLARFGVDTIAQLDLSAIDARRGARGGEPDAPEILPGIGAAGDRSRHRHGAGPAPSELARALCRRTAAPADAGPTVQLAHKLQTAIGQAIDGARKCAVQPVIGIIKDVLGFRRFSLRGAEAATGEWCLVCLAFNLKRRHHLTVGRA